MDYWEKLKAKKIFLFGMGDGADKILSVMEKKGLVCSGFFASDEFVRGQSFRGMPVRTLGQIEKENADFSVLVAFGSHLPEVLGKVEEIGKKHDLFLPDVPPCGGELFDGEYAEKNAGKIALVRSLFADERSKQVFDAIVDFRLSGSLSDLRKSECDRNEVWETLLGREDAVFLDAGAYRGDTASEFLLHRKAERIIAVEPDKKSAAKCGEFLEKSGVPFELVSAAVWDRDGVMPFLTKGSRSSRIGNGRTETIETRSVDSILAGRKADYIKYDVEGAEREAILGSEKTIRTFSPDLCVSLYHRGEDLLELPLLIEKMQPGYRMFLRRFPCIPAWDLNLYCVNQSSTTRTVFMR